MGGKVLALGILLSKMIQADWGGMVADQDAHVIPILTFENSLQLSWSVDLQDVIATMLTSLLSKTSVHVPQRWTQLLGKHSV